jgi:hypothetical protein
MANTDSSLIVTELDFEQIKSNLKKFLKTQDEFTDYNFEASGLNVLIDLLAYNTHINSFYLNMIANEMFLDSATLRESVVSHAKMLGYTPRSFNSSKALANVIVKATDAQYPYGSLTLPRFTRFISQPVSGKNYIFLTKEQYTASKNTSNGTYDFAEVELYEGVAHTQVFNVDKVNNPKQEFNLPDIGIDTSTIQIVVQTSSQNTKKNTYKLATDSTEVANNSQVYYLEEYKNGYYKIYFGDDIIGASLKDGNIVIASYVTTTGQGPNGAAKFTMVDTLIPGATNFVSVLSAAAGGGVIETIDSIKYSAPKNYAAQNRAVTKNDYITLLNRKYPYFDAITVWGGEESNPPVYGKVFISAKPKLGYTITNIEKQYIVDEVIKPFCVVTVTPEVVDPDYTYFNYNCRVDYDPKSLLVSPGSLETAIRNTLLTYSRQNLNSFNSTFKHSRILRAIDDTDPAILSSELDYFLEKRFSPRLGVYQSITLNFYNELQRFSGVVGTGLYTSPFYQTYDSGGIIRDVSIEEVPQSFSGIESIIVTDGGSGYADAPIVSIVGDGTGAKASATIVNGKVTEVTITNPGTEYTSAQIYLNGNSTKTATAKAVISARYGKLRSFYYDENKNKKILNDSAGTVDYLLGKVVITDFQPISVSSPDNVLTMHAKPLSLTVESSKNSILTLDENDPFATLVSLNAINT